MKKNTATVTATPRTIAWFSCGAASAVATKIALKENPDIEIVYQDTGGEHKDNIRFLKDCEKWFGKKIIINSVEAIFKLGGNEIYLEARDITVRILQKIGGEILGDSVDFYGEPVTPVILKKSHYLNKV